MSGTSPTPPNGTAHQHEKMEQGAISDKAIDAGAKALRQRLQGGKRLTPWADLPNSSKRKWHDYAAVVLCAAACVEGSKP